MRDLPSLAAPIITLLALPTSDPDHRGIRDGHVMVVATVGTGGGHGLSGPSGPADGFAGRQADPMFLSRALLVTITFNLARALALVTRAGHHRQPASPLPANR
jgi:hypothetical protein